MTQTHTPGPWGIERTDKDFRIFHDGDSEHPGYGLIAIIPAVSPIDEANAYQIVKTPTTRAERDRLRETNAELLAECRRLLREDEARYSDKPAAQALFKHNNASLIAAIAKAEAQ